MGLTFSVSIVTYLPNLEVLHETLSALAVQNVEFISVSIIDNSPVGHEVAGLHAYPFPVNVISGHGNIGYGRAHNLALGAVGDIHLVLNPDAILENGAILQMIQEFRARPKMVLASPGFAEPGTTRTQYLCKRFPSAGLLLLRFLNNKTLNNVFDEDLARYEYRHETNLGLPFMPQIVSGACMFFRGKAFEQLRGFDPQFFLYFEDFDIALRAHSLGEVWNFPGVRVLHYGGGAGRKGLRHIRYFAVSAIKFFLKWNLSRGAFSRSQVDGAKE